MNEAEQRMAIAGACGWVTDVARPDTVWRVYEEPGVAMPDYLNSLDAMHEAEKVLTDDQWYTYIEHITGKSWFVSWNFTQIKDVASATAAHRAEAFLRALNLWTE